MYNGSNKCAKKGGQPIQRPSTLSTIFVLDLMLYTKAKVLKWELNNQTKVSEIQEIAFESLDYSLIITFIIMILSPVQITNWPTSLITHPAAITTSIFPRRALFMGNKTHHSDPWPWFLLQFIFTTLVTHQNDIFDDSNILVGP